MAKKRQKYSVFIYSEAAPDAKYAIYKHTRRFRVLQYMILIYVFMYDNVISYIDMLAIALLISSVLLA